MILIYTRKDLPAATTGDGVADTPRSYPLEQWALATHERRPSSEGLARF